MRLGLHQSLRAEQRLIQSPQMIQAMQVLQLPLLELKDQIDQEPQENVFLERKDESERSDPPAPAPDVPPGIVNPPQPAAPPVQGGNAPQDPQDAPEV